MRRSTRVLVPPLLAAAAGLLLTACARTYTVSTQMPPGNEMSIEVTGSNPLVMIHNDGPGALQATFDAGDELAETKSISPRTASGQTLHGSKQVHLKTGLQPTMLKIEASRATGLRLHAPAPQR